MVVDKGFVYEQERRNGTQEILKFNKW